MINIDAKVKDSNGDICRVECVYDDGILASYGGSHAEDSDFLKHGTYTVIEDIRGDLEQQKQRADAAEKLIKRAIEIGELRLNDLSNGVTSIGFGERKGIEQVLSALKNLERGEE